jgi:hypothetical protein
MIDVALLFEGRPISFVNDWNLLSVVIIPAFYSFKGSIGINRSFSNYSNSALSSLIQPVPLMRQP